MTVLKTNSPVYQAAVAAYEALDSVRFLRIAWVRCGSWELGPLCAELERLSRQVWGEDWERVLWDLRLHTTSAVRAVRDRAVTG